jgi:lipopolysaccharide/colanic/teichoic acid biosynthesis glycosyltransferase
MSYQSKHQEAFSQVRVMLGGDTLPSGARPAGITPAQFGRAAFNRLFAGAALLFFAPVMLAIAATLLLREGGPVLFSQERVGKGGRRFRCLKFRTMVPDAAERLERILATDPVARAEWEVSRKLTNDPRVSCFGNFLRKSSLDELPQFINVLRGDMAIVGPRPIVAEELPLYGDDVEVYLTVRPGITGLWQVSGRSDTTFSERVALDRAYVSARGPAFDLWIILRTVVVLITRKGAR